ncbi:unnamed protein product [Peronospora destructor]|uniref:Uncharacterized protein n=1 Tax=Peronospora destructor TaxID=86335 RepID=A0AAV0V9K6_9STRA|nr:unnamed protein product [Peronospora destructor]
MCVYLTPRWRRRLFVLALTLTQLLLTADPRTLRKLNVRHKTEHPDSELTSVVDVELDDGDGQGMEFRQQQGRESTKH